MIYLTTAIDYPNGSPHIGHAYEKVLTDILARYHRLAGEDVYFLTGVDQHGQKMVQTAEKEGVNVATLAKRNTKKFRQLLQVLSISNDGWAETIDERHQRCVQEILNRLHQEGQLYKKSYQGFYSVRQEQFLTEKERNEDGTFGPEWGEVVELEEENWYFRLSDHLPWLQSAIENQQIDIEPEFRRAEVLNAIARNPEADLCISRPKARLPWGIELPFDPDYVTYVWFDALINYISFAGYLAQPEDDLPDFSTLWPASRHVIGKDILVPAHAIYWPCMLHAMGFQEANMPGFLVHGWWNASGEKMSKSLGNIIDPTALAEKFGPEPLRYYLARDITTGKDANFDLERLVILYNTELANDLGNLLNRSLNMTKRYLQGTLPPSQTQDEDELTQSLHESRQQTTTSYRASLDAYDLQGALKALNQHVTKCNAYVEQTKPWELAKEPDNHDKQAKLATILRQLCESCATLALLLKPFLPEAADRIARQLNLEHWPQLTLADLAQPLLPAQHQTGKPKPVFPRMEAPTAEPES